MPTKKQLHQHIIIAIEFPQYVKSRGVQVSALLSIVFWVRVRKGLSITITFGGITDSKKKKLSCKHFRSFLIGLSSMQLFLVSPKLRIVGLKISAAKVKVKEYYDYNNIFTPSFYWAPSKFFSNLFLCILVSNNSPNYLEFEPWMHIADRNVNTTGLICAEYIVHRAK